MHITKLHIRSQKIQEYLRRVRAFGPIGYLRFLFHKACWVYADGTFFYGQEGGFHFSGRPAVRTWLSRVFQSIAYEDLPGYQRGYAYFAQGFCCALWRWATRSSGRDFLARRTIASSLESC